MAAFCLPCSSGMRARFPPTWSSSEKLYLFALCLSSLIASATAPYPIHPDVQACTNRIGPPLNLVDCQAAIDNLPRGTLPSIFTIRAPTATNNYIQVPVQYLDTQVRPKCMVTIDLDGHSRTDQFVIISWDEIREMAQVVVDNCVELAHLGGFITYGVGRTFESLIDPTAYEGIIPTPASVLQPDGTIEFVAIPSTPARVEYSKLGGTFQTNPTVQSPFID